MYLDIGRDDEDDFLKKNLAMKITMSNIMMRNTR